MVDLGFLLISFFMLTTTMANQKAMAISMPAPPAVNEPPTAYPEESTVTVIPVKGHRVFYYNGSYKAETRLADCSVTGFRDVLLKQKAEAARLPANLSTDAHKLHVVIKPNDDCKYDDVVQLLDDMNIVDVTYYALVDLAPEEKELLPKK